MTSADVAGRPSNSRSRTGVGPGVARNVLPHPQHGHHDEPEQRSCAQGGDDRPDAVRRRTAKVRRSARAGRADRGAGQLGQPARPVRSRSTARHCWGGSSKPPTWLDSHCDLVLHNAGAAVGRDRGIPDRCLTV